MINNSIKEYYTKLLSMYENVVNMTTALSQSLTTGASEVSVNITNADNTSSTVKIPSMLYMESKLEQMQNNFNNLFTMPKNGEAWLSKNDDMFKLQLVKAGTAPVTPEYDSTSVIASIKDNNFLRDLVSPKTFLRFNLKNLPDNIEQVMMKKYIFNNESVYNSLLNMKLESYEAYAAALYNLVKGVDYDVYDSKVELPVRNSRYIAKFKLMELDSDMPSNPWIENETRLNYRVQLDTLQYHNADDSSIEFTLKIGDLISMADNLAIYKVKNVNSKTMTVDIEEYVGHMTLCSVNENQNMVFTLYEHDYSEFQHVDVPIEENPYICVFFGYIDNNTRSTWSTPYLVNLNGIMMYDQYGNKIVDKNGTHMTYMEYYKEYCINIGDLILGISKEAYPQVSNFDNKLLYLLQTSEAIGQSVTNSIAPNIKVVPINKHLIETTSTEEIINLHAQKSDISSQLQTLQSNIDNVYSTLISTDFTQEVSITQESLRKQLQAYYAQRVTLQKQLNAIIDSIAASSADVTVAREGTKYSIRGVSNITDIDAYIKQLAGDTVDVIGLDIEYKYKSPTKDTTSVMNIESNIFTDWQKQTNIERQRHLVFNASISSYSIEYVDYSSTQNIIKWNQIDIPIVKGEDVVIRARYKYNIGTPYFDMYTPWSSEITMSFPTEFAGDSDVAAIMAKNDNDVAGARFSQTLINEGYQEHINNAITVNDKTFYHMPENIYSGFNTSDNNFISLKDKLQTMVTDIDTVKNAVAYEANKKYALYLAYDNKTIEIFNNTINKISIYNSDHVTDSFVKKQMNLIIKNTGDVSVKLYSIFPGNIDIPLLQNNDEFYEQYITHYERVPMFVDNKIAAQTLGQWIYFRQDNPYTGHNIYYRNETQDIQDVRLLNSTAERLLFNGTNRYMWQDNNQMLLGYRKRTTGNIESLEVKWIGLNFNADGTFEQLTTNDDGTTETLNDKYSQRDLNFFLYDTSSLDNNFLCRFEDICGVNSKGKTVFLDAESSISEFIAANNVNGIGTASGSFIGAFLFPDIEGRANILTNGNYNAYKEIEVGKSLSIPITFEYYIDGEQVTEITKSMYFDLRDSMIQDPQHYMIEMTAYYDYTSTGNLINNASISLKDEATAY